jgi:hypothetical protein
VGGGVVVGGAVVGCTVIGGAVIGGAGVGGAVVGGAVVGCTVISGAVIGGAGVDGAVVGGAVVSALEVIGAFVGPVCCISEEKWEKGIIPWLMEVGGAARVGSFVGAVGAFVGEAVGEPPAPPPAPAAGLCVGTAMGGTHFGLMYLCTALVHANCSLVNPGHPFAVFGAIGRESAMRTSLKGSVVGPRETEVIACGQMWSNPTIAPSTM